MGDLTGWMLAVGWLDANTFVADEANDIGNFPRQADMVVGRDWFRPGNESDVITYPEFVVDLAYGKGSFGGAEWKWHLRMLTPLMSKYLKTNFFVNQWFTECTVRTFNREGGWEVYHAIAHRPNPADLELEGGGYKYSIPFVEGVLQEVED